MRTSRLTGLAIAIAIASLLGASGVVARTPVDPTSLTPPLLPFRVCWELGPYVQCDTSGDSSSQNETVGDLGCGEIYETADMHSHSTRWYEDGLLIRRQVQDSVRGFWSLSPTGDGPRVEFMRNSSWNELFTIPGDIDSAVRTSHGADLRVPALGSGLLEAGSFTSFEDMHGHFPDDSGYGALLCPLLVG